MAITGPGGASRSYCGYFAVSNASAVVTGVLDEHGRIADRVTEQDAMLVARRPTHVPDCSEPFSWWAVEDLNL